MSTRTIDRPAQVRNWPGARAPRAYPAGWTIVLLVNDVTLFTIALGLGSLIGFHAWHSARIVTHLLIAVALYVGLWVLLFDRLGLYRRTFALSMKDELYYTIAALILGMIPQFILFTLYPGISTSRLALLCALGFSIVMVGSSRALLHRIRDSQWIRARRRICVVGPAPDIERVVNSLEVGDDSETLRIAIDDIASTVTTPDGQRGRDLRDIEWFDRAVNWGCDSLILTQMIPPHGIGGILEAATRGHVRLSFAPPAITRFAYNLSLKTDGRQVLIVPSRLRACTPRAQLLKRLMDVVLGCVALLLFAPIMIAAAIAVYLDSGCRSSTSKNALDWAASRFGYSSFARCALTPNTRAAPNGPPRTTLARRESELFCGDSAIDEMPQVFNVLRGDMSLVGPRPERPIFVELFRKTLARYEERHLVRPGITGWSHVHMKRDVETSAAGERLAYDLQYVENWSPFLDIGVLFQTLCEFLFHRAA